MQNKMRVLSVDPGYGRMGVAVLEGAASSPKLVFSVCIETDKKNDHEKRLFIMRDKLFGFIDEYKPDVLALETLLFSKNQKTALKVAESRGAILSVAGEIDLPVFEINPMSVKTAVTSYGKSDKRQLEVMVRNLIKVSKDKKLDDEIDAIAIGIACLATNREMRFPQLKV